MKLLEERILRDGEFKGNDIVRVDSFLNCQMDINLISEIGKEFFRLSRKKASAKNFFQRPAPCARAVLSAASGCIGKHC